MMNEKKPNSYTTPDGEIKVEAVFQNESIGLKGTMTEHFGVQVSAVSKPLKNIFKSGELNEKGVISILKKPTEHGAIKEKTQTQETKDSNLEAMIVF